jgi:hypothetical protein
MRRSDTIAGGVAAIAFAVLTAIAIFFGGPLGGDFSASDIAAYLARDHVVIAGALALCGLVGAAALVAVGAYLRKWADLEGGGSIWPATSWGLTLGSAVCFAVSWGIAVSQPIGNNESGTNLNVPPTITYSIGITGTEVLFESAATLLGLAMILIAATNLPRLPGWLRWLTLAVGVLALTSLAFFTFFPILLWAIALGVWLLARPRPAAP